MFELAFLIGTFSYAIFFLGVLGFLYKSYIIVVLLLFFLSGLYYFYYYKRIMAHNYTLKKISRVSKILITIIILQVSVNLVGVLGPEISFDALWYHLTLPKIYLEAHRIFHIPGGLLYYSDIPKNIEMIFLACLSFGNETWAKFSHFLFGLLTILVTYKFARKFLNENLSLFASALFYSNLVVGWESITAYVDLGTTFFTTVALYCFWEWLEKKTNKFLIFTAVITGLTVATKTVSLNLIPVFGLLILVKGFRDGYTFLRSSFNLVLFTAVSVVVGSPWFIFSFLNTGNPFYPLFDPTLSIVNKFYALGIVNVFLRSQDPISPVYLITLPLIIYFLKRFSLRVKMLFLFFISALILWYLDSQVGDSRFLLPYLPALSVLSVISIDKLHDKFLKRYLFALIIILVFFSASYRFMANAKYIPVLLRSESKSEFLSKHLNFSFGDFYDSDGYFKTHVKPTDKVLLYGFHNLYYVDFPFIDSSYVKKGDRFDYIAVQSGNIPTRFSSWNRIYYNSLTKVSLYSLGGKQWVY